MRNSTKIAVCALTTAMSVVLLFLGGITFVFAYLMPMIVGLFSIVLDSTFGKQSAVLTYLATGILSFILVADRECVLMYIAVFGIYPILKEYFERARFKAASYCFKLLFFNTVLALTQLALVYVFGIPFLESGESKWFIAVFAVMMNILFIVYDRMLTVLTVVYKAKIEKRIKKYFK
jgi:hypothetical protein